MAKKKIEEMSVTTTTLTGKKFRAIVVSGTQIQFEDMKQHERMVVLKENLPEFEELLANAKKKL